MFSEDKIVHAALARFWYSGVRALWDYGPRLRLSGSRCFRLAMCWKTNRKAVGLNSATFSPHTFYIWNYYVKSLCSTTHGIYFSYNLELVQISVKSDPFGCWITFSTEVLAFTLWILYSIYRQVMLETFIMWKYTR